MFFENFVQVRFTWRFCFIFLSLEDSGMWRMKLLLLLFNIAFSGLLSSSNSVECFFKLSWNNCEPGTSFSGYLIKNFWKLTDLLCVTDEEIWMCWITVSWSHDFAWSFSWDYDIYYLVSEEVRSSQQIQKMYLLIG